MFTTSMSLRKYLFLLKKWVDLLPSSNTSGRRCAITKTLTMEHVFLKSTLIHAQSIQNLNVCMRTSGSGGEHVSADGAPPLTARTPASSESSHTGKGSPISELPSRPCIASCNTGIALLGLGIGTDEEGGSGGVCGGDVGGSGG